MIRLWNRVRMPRRSDTAAAFIRVPVALAHLGFALVALSRWIGYSNLVSPAHESPGPAFLTDGGTLLPLWAGAWLITGALLLYEGLSGRPRVALILYAALAEVWGLSYVVAWVRSGLHSPDWLTGALYCGSGLGVAAVAVGLIWLIQWVQARRALDTGIIHAVQDPRGEEDH